MLSFIRELPLEFLHSPRDGEFSETGPRSRLLIECRFEHNVIHIGLQYSSITLRSITVLVGGFGPFVIFLYLGNVILPN